MMGEIRAYEELAMNAWPALQTHVEDGWILCRSRGYTKRANSVQPLYPAERPLTEKIAGCEAFYRRAGQPCVFKLTEATEPPGLDRELERRGYALVDEVSIQRVELGALEDPAHTEMEVSRKLTGAWLDAFCEYNPSHRPHRETIAAMFESPLYPCGFGALKSGGRTVACGLVVVQDGRAGLFDIVTDPTARRQGYGEALILHLLRWAREQGAREAYLQVLADNAPAVKLYAKLGFTELYRQWFRVQP